MFETTMVGKTDEILSQFPKSAELLKGFVRKNLIRFYTRMTEGIGMENTKNLVETLILQGVRSTIEILPRNLYEFFDENEVFINIYPFKKDNKIYWYFCEYDSTIREKLENSRQEAEKDAFLKAFSILEDRLNINKSD